MHSFLVISFFKLKNEFLFFYYDYTQFSERSNLVIRQDKNHI
jgi:hypothetical protein